IQLMHHVLTFSFLLFLNLGYMKLKISPVIFFTVSKRCSCVTKRKRVKATLIVEIKERPPRSYCSSHEIIATLNPGGKSCLDPKSPFIQEAVRTFKKRK
uniref:Chemokine interleukin-8-like domain-containing protein n=1 Tax=Salarias fasciatus TaxID=181472 RepID=A0A672FWB2_SALFA